MTGPTTHEASTNPRAGSRVAFIGLGIMGAPMAVNLQRAGYDVVGFNRTPGKAAALIDVGGSERQSIAEAVAGADVVITMLPDSPDVTSVLLGDDGVLAHAKDGAVLIDFSTIAPETSQEVAEQAAARGARALDAPVSGGEQGAIDATLSIMVGGDENLFTEMQPILSAVGKTVTYVGPTGSGQTVKAANQLIVAGGIQLVAEAMVFLQAQGVDREAALRVLQGGLAGSTVLDRKGPSMLARDFAPGFRIDLHHKDLGIYTSSARESGVASPLGQVLAGLMGSARAQGYGSLDHSALLLQAERLSGQSGDAS